MLAIILGLIVSYLITRFVLVEQIAKIKNENTRKIVSGVVFFIILLIASSIFSVIIHIAINATF